MPLHHKLTTVAERKIAAETSVFRHPADVPGGNGFPGRHPRRCRCIIWLESKRGGAIQLGFEFTWPE
jgi:hypothetical protein